MDLYKNNTSEVVNLITFIKVFYYYAQISTLKLILKLLQLVLVLIHHIQGIYNLCHQSHELLK